MKKIIIASISFLFVFMFAIGNISAASYSNTKTSTLSIANGNYRLSRTATYKTAGDIRWTYGPNSLTFLSGISAKSSSVTKSETTNGKKVGDVQSTTRKYYCTATNVNYFTQNIEKSLT